MFCHCFATYNFQRQHKFNLLLISYLDKICVLFCILNGEDKFNLFN